MTARSTDVNGYVSCHLDTNGDGTGSTDANVNGSVTPVLFKLSPPESGWLRAARMLVHIRQGGVFRAETYGALGELANGIKIGWWNDADELVGDFLDGETITTNAGWGHWCYDVDLKTWGNGDSFILVRWTFAKGGTVPILHPGSYHLGVQVNDDLTGLASHAFVIQGARSDR